jgi:hypothetical protein
VGRVARAGRCSRVPGAVVQLGRYDRFAPGACALAIPFPDIDREARELYLVELYRQDRISHAQLRDALGAGFHEAEGLIKEHGAGHDLPVDEFEKQRAFLRGAKR